MESAISLSNTMKPVARSAGLKTLQKHKLLGRMAYRLGLC